MSPARFLPARLTGADGYTGNYDPFLSVLARTLRAGMAYFGPGFQFTPAPEPSSVFLVGVGLALVAFGSWRAGGASGQ